MTDPATTVADLRKATKTALASLETIKDQLAGCTCRTCMWSKAEMMLAELLVRNLSLKIDHAQLTDFLTSCFDTTGKIHDLDPMHLDPTDDPAGTA